MSREEVLMTKTNTAQRIVVVEDDPMIRRVIELCLDQPARQVDLRADGDAGLEAVRNLDPDLVIIDIALPGIDGWEVLRRLRLGRRTTPSVLILTAYGDSATRDRAEVEGADAFLSKPFRPQDLRKVVDLLV